MHNIHTNYQTSFRVEDADDSNLYRIQMILLNWLTKKKREWFLDGVIKDFLFRGEWVSPTNKHSKIETDTFLDGTNKAWAVRYSHADTQLGPRRFWYVDVGLHKVANEVVVFIRISYAWHAEDLGVEQEAPGTSVPKFISKILEGTSMVYSGRREFQLIQKPAVFRNVGQGLALSQFITSKERRYPLIVINGDDEEFMKEAVKLAEELTGKCQVAVIGTNPELAEEIRHCLSRDYRIDYGKLRVFFPFALRYNTVARHRWYDLRSAEYANQRPGILNGLLRNNALLERECVESVDTIRQLVARSKFMALRDKSEAQSTDMKAFFELFDQVENKGMNISSSPTITPVRWTIWRNRLANWHGRQLSWNPDLRPNQPGPMAAPLPTCFPSCQPTSRRRLRLLAASIRISSLRNLPRIRLAKPMTVNALKKCGRFLDR